LGKALGSAGGFICGSRALVEYLVNCARTFIFSTAPVPAAAAAATAGIRFVRSGAGEERVAALWHRVSEMEAGRDAFHRVPCSSEDGDAVERVPTGIHGSQGRSAIIPILIGAEDRAVAAAAALREQGIFVPAIRYPTVARGKARLRVTLSAAHTFEEVKRLIEALGRIRSGR